VRTAIISDVHGNLEALEAVERVLREMDVRSLLFAGDAVGYGPDPEACTRWVERHAAFSVAGNHDHAAVGAADAGGFNPLARTALEWTRGMLSAGSAAWLVNLPLMGEAEGAALVHANPRQPAEWGYIMTLWEADISFGYFTAPFCFIGHSHHPVMVRRDPRGTVTVIPGETFRVEEGCRYLVNVGSVGQPRDRNPSACFGLLDRGSGGFSLVRVPYDVGRTQEKMRRAGLPEPLAARLAEGR
jgi:diadenosine tetraphosphatase ApaH/serine/threonine PP2A family protein phosphatase